MSNLSCADNRLMSARDAAASRAMSSRPFLGARGYRREAFQSFHQVLSGETFLQLGQLGRGLLRLALLTQGKDRPERLVEHLRLHRNRLALAWATKSPASAAWTFACCAAWAGGRSARAAGAAGATSAISCGASPDDA